MGSIPTAPPKSLGLWRSWERDSMAWNRSGVRTSPGIRVEAFVSPSSVADAEVIEAAGCDPV